MDKPCVGLPMTQEFKSVCGASVMQLAPGEGSKNWMAEDDLAAAANYKERQRQEAEKAAAEAPKSKQKSPQKIDWLIVRGFLDKNRSDPARVTKAAERFGCHPSAIYNHFRRNRLAIPSGAAPCAAAEAQQGAPAEVTAAPMGAPKAPPEPEEGPEQQMIDGAAADFVRLNRILDNISPYDSPATIRAAISLAQAFIRQNVAKKALE